MIARLDAAIELREISVAEAYAWLVDGEQLPTSHAAVMLEITVKLSAEMKRPVDLTTPLIGWVRPYHAYKRQRNRTLSCSVESQGTAGDSGSQLL